MKTLALLTLITALSPIAQANDKIIGGHKSAGHDFFLQLSMDGSLDRAFCGSTAIAPGVAVTAAHCVASKTPFKLVHGMDQDGIKTLKVIDVNAVISHQGYKGTANDIALIFFNEEQAGSAVVAAPINRGQIGLNDNTALLAIGRGNKTSIGTLYDNILYEVRVPYINRTTCQAVEEYSDAITDFHECAGVVETGGSDSCQGDSGGPLVAMVNGKATLIGVTNFGLGCGQKGYPGVYASLKAHASWVDANIARYKQNESVTDPNIDFAFSSKCHTVGVSEEVLQQQNAGDIAILSLSSQYLPKTRFMSTGVQLLSSSAKTLCEFKIGNDSYVAKYDKATSQKVVIQNTTKNKWFTAQGTRKTDSLYQRCMQFTPTSLSFDIAVGDGAAMIMFGNNVGRLVEISATQKPADATKIASCSVNKYETEITTSPSTGYVLVTLKNHIDDLTKVFAMVSASGNSTGGQSVGKLEASLSTNGSNTAILTLENNSDQDLFTWEIRCNKDFSAFNANKTSNRSIRYMAPIDDKGTVLEGESMVLTLNFAAADPNGDGKLECTINRDLKVSIK